MTFIITHPAAEFYYDDIVTRMHRKFSISPVICQVAAADHHLERFNQKGHTRSIVNRKQNTQI